MIFILTLWLLSLGVFSQSGSALTYYADDTNFIGYKNIDTTLLYDYVIHEIIEKSQPVKNFFLEYSLRDDTLKHYCILDSALFDDKWHELPQALFWQQMMKLPGDTAIVSRASDRMILCGIPSKSYDTLSKTEKQSYKQKIAKEMGLNQSEKLYVTFGRKDYYNIENVLLQIDTAIGVFAEQGVDPFYAQAVILIESPNRLEYSWAGAYGPFQLMKSIGLKYGLLINDTIDERADLSKAALVTAKYFQEFCIPQVKELMNSRKITFSENDLWFRLLVLHVYHAGYGNVRGVINTINPSKGGMSLIQKVWETEYQSFKNASQNYSQVAIAAMMQMNDFFKEKAYAKDLQTFKER